MAKQTSLITVNPNVIKWIIESSGWEFEELAKKLNMSEESVHNLVLRESPIEIRKLEKFADCVKRPLAVFFLPKPPSEPKLTDYRKVYGIETKKLSKKTLSAVREARYFQSIAKELLGTQRLNLKPKITNVTLKNNPETVALQERKKLGFESEEELLSKEARKSPRNFYNKLREKIESLNIFVFQVGMPIKEARGFTLTDDFPRTIIVNSSDSIKPKIFTLLHEYGHILLKTEGICLSASELNKENSKNELQRVERWCNAFAGSVLMPKKEFLIQTAKLEERYDDPKKIIDQLSNQFKASKQAVVVRTLRLNPKSDFAEYYRDSFEEIKSDALSKSKKNAGKGGPHPVDMCLSQRGRKFVSLVLDSKNKNLINFNNMMDYLNLNLKHLEKLQEKL